MGRLFAGKRNRQKDSTANKKKSAKHPNLKQRENRNPARKKQEKISEPQRKEEQKEAKGKPSESTMKEGQKAKKKEEVKPSESKTKEEPKTLKKEEPKKKKRRKAEGTTLVLRNLQTSAETRYNHVISYAFTENGAYLIFPPPTKTAQPMASTPFAPARATPQPYSRARAITKKLSVTNPVSISHLSPTATALTQSNRNTPSIPGALAPAIRQKKSPGLEPRAYPPIGGSANTPPSPFPKTANASFSEPRPDQKRKQKTTRPTTKKSQSISGTGKTPISNPCNSKTPKRNANAPIAPSFTSRMAKSFNSPQKPSPLFAWGKRGQCRCRGRHFYSPLSTTHLWDSPAYYDSYLIDIQTGAATRVLTKMQARPHPLLTRVQLHLLVGSHPEKLVCSACQKRNPRQCQQKYPPSRSQRIARLAVSTQRTWQCRMDKRRQRISHIRPLRLMAHRSQRAQSTRQHHRRDWARDRNELSICKLDPKRGARSQSRFALIGFQSQNQIHGLLSRPP